MGLRFEEIPTPGYERVTFAEDGETGLRALIAIHSTALGPACGGIRLLPYASRAEALEDVLRLSKGMSYKSSLAGISFGGGKSVILADPSRKSAVLFQAMGRFVEAMGGKYIAAKDMNVTAADLLEVKKTTTHVLGIEGLPGSSGDPSPLTAVGTFRGIEAALNEIQGNASVKGLTFAVQGLGHVGWGVAERIHQGGGKLWVTDIDRGAVERAVKLWGAVAVAPEEIYDVDCTVFVPCARGAILNPQTLPRLRCKAVVGCANNQLSDAKVGWALHERGVLYAPDYAVNAGGIINIFYERGGTYDATGAQRKAVAIYDTLREIFARARREGRPPFLVADTIAEERIRGVR